MGRALTDITAAHPSRQVQKYRVGGAKILSASGHSQPCTRLPQLPTTPLASYRAHVREVKNAADMAYTEPKPRRRRPVKPENKGPVSAYAGPDVNPRGCTCGAWRLGPVDSCLCQPARAAKPNMFRSYAGAQPRSRTTLPSAAQGVAHQLVKQASMRSRLAAESCKVSDGGWGEAAARGTRWRRKSMSFIRRNSTFNMQHAQLELTVKQQQQEAAMTQSRHYQPLRRDNGHSIVRYRRRPGFQPNEDGLSPFVGALIGARRMLTPV